MLPSSGAGLSSAAGLLLTARLPGLGGGFATAALAAAGLRTFGGITKRTLFWQPVSTSFQPPCSYTLDSFHASANANPPSILEEVKVVRYAASTLIGSVEPQSK